MFCYACLSTDRNVSVLGQCYDIYLKICDIDSELPPVPLYLCWECKALLYRVKEFKTRVIQAQQFLSSYVNDVKACPDHLQSTVQTRPQKMMLNNLRSLLSLSCVTKSTYDAEFFTIDTLTEDSLDLKPDIECIKEEIKEKVNDAVNDREGSHSTEEDLVESKVNNFDSDCKDNISIHSENYEPIDCNENPSSKELEIDGQLTEEMSKMFEEIVFTEEKMTRSREAKRKHYNHKKLPFKCDTCVLGFRRRKHFDSHVKSKHDRRRGDLSCPVCNVKFSTEEAVNRHKRRHYVWYRCRLCNYATTELWRALNHRRNKHSDDSIDYIHCTQCRVIATSPEDLEQHMRTIHTSYFCNECGAKFEGKDPLRKHLRSVHAVRRRFMCDVCKKAFEKKTTLESHISNHNAAIMKKLSFCAVCKIQYKTIFIYRDHLKYSPNHAERLYPCLVCDKRFSSPFYLRRHNDFYHLHKSEFKCDLCNKLFISCWKLKHHSQVHHGLQRTRNHQCDICEKKFYTLRTLQGHKQTHSKHRSYMCENCGKTFKQRPALYSHYRLVHRAGKKQKK